MIKERNICIILLGLLAIFMISCSNRNTDNSDTSSNLSSNKEVDISKDDEINLYYAGSYYDTNGKIICCYTDKLEMIKEFFKLPNTTYIQVKYNVNQLKDTYEAFNSILGQYEIEAAGISYSENSVIVTLKSFDNLEDIKAKINCDSVIFQLAAENSTTIFNN